MLLIMGKYPVSAIIKRYNKMGKYPVSAVGDINNGEVSN